MKKQKYQTPSVEQIALRTNGALMEGLSMGISDDPAPGGGD